MVYAFTFVVFINRPLYEHKKRPSYVMCFLLEQGTLSSALYLYLSNQENTEAKCLVYDRVQTKQYALTLQDSKISKYINSRIMKLDTCMWNENNYARSFVV